MCERERLPSWPQHRGHRAAGGKVVLSEREGEGGGRRQGARRCPSPAVELDLEKVRCLCPRPCSFNLSPQARREGHPCPGKLTPSWRSALLRETNTPLAGPCSHHRVVAALYGDLRLRCVPVPSSPSSLPRCWATCLGRASTSVRGEDKLEPLDPAPGLTVADTLGRVLRLPSVASRGSSPARYARGTRQVHRWYAKGAPGGHQLAA